MNECKNQILHEFVYLVVVDILKGRRIEIFQSENVKKRKKFAKERPHTFLPTAIP